jgi:adenylate cyclase
VRVASGEEISSEERVERRLTAIPAADVVGYSRLMGADEEGTLTALKAIRRELVDPRIVEHRGRIVKTTGDGLLVEFASVVDAVRCAVDVQRRQRASGDAHRVPRRHHPRRHHHRLRRHLRRRRQRRRSARNLGGAGLICVSRVVRDQVRDKLDFAFHDRGEVQVKNITRPVRVFDLRILLGETDIGTV